MTLICWVCGSQSFEGILSLHIQASSSLRKTTSTEGVVTCIVLSVGGWLKVVVFLVTVHLTAPFKGHTIISRTFPHPQLANHPHQPYTKQYHYIYMSIITLFPFWLFFLDCMSDCVPAKCQKQLTQ